MREGNGGGDVKAGSKVGGKTSNGEVAAPKTAWTLEEIDRLTQEAQVGDVRAMVELRRAMAAVPGLAEELSDMARFARSKMLEATFGKDYLLLRETVQQRAQQMRRELEMERPQPPSTLERMLIERIVTCWVEVYLVNVVATANGMTLTKAEFYDQRHDRAHRRYLSALTALARVRRLLALGPLVAQVNIAQAGAQQMNMVEAAT